MASIQWKKLFVCLAVPQLAGLVGSLFTTPFIASWYNLQHKPALAPPNWVFGPVWTTLFLLMGVALYLVWSAGASRRAVRLATQVFALQLFLNMLWSFLFFGLQRPAYAFVEVIFFWLAILATAVVFFRIRKIAGVLLVPYLLWVGFAAYLNLMVWILN